MEPIKKGDKIVVDGYTTEVEKVESFVDGHALETVTTVWYRTQYGNLTYTVSNNFKKL